MQRKITREEMQRLYADKKYEDRVAFMYTAGNDFYEPGQGGLKQLIEDYYYRTFILNDHHNMGLHPSRAQLSKEQPRHSDQEILDQLRLIIGTANDELVGHFIEAHSQGIATFVPMILGNGTEDRVSGNITEDSLIIRQPQGSQKISVRVVGGDLFLSAEFDQFDVVRAANDKEIVGRFTGPVTTTYKLAQKDGKWAYELMYVETDNEDMIALMRGELLTNKQIIDKYCDKNFFPQYLFEEELRKLVAINPSTSETEKLKRNAVIVARQSEKELCGPGKQDSNEHYRVLARQLKNQRETILEQEAAAKVNLALHELERLYQELNRPADVMPRTEKSLKTLFRPRREDDPGKIFDPLINALEDSFQSLYEVIDKSKGLDELLPFLIRIIDALSGVHGEMIFEGKRHDALQEIYPRLIDRVSEKFSNDKKNAAYMFTMMMSALPVVHMELLWKRSGGDIRLDMLTEQQAMLLFDIRKDVLAQEVERKQKRGEACDDDRGLLETLRQEERTLENSDQLSGEERKKIFFNMARKASGLPVLDDPVAVDDDDKTEVLYWDESDAPGLGVSQASVQEGDDEIMASAPGGGMEEVPVLANEAAIHAALPVNTMRDNLAAIAQALIDGDNQRALIAIYELSRNIDKLKPWMKGKILPNEKESVDTGVGVVAQILEKYYPSMQLSDKLHDEQLMRLKKNGAILQEAIQIYYDRVAQEEDAHKIGMISPFSTAMKSFAILIDIDFTDRDIEIDFDVEVVPLAKSLGDGIHALDKLSNACDDYMSHLRGIIYEGIRDGDYDLFWADRENRVLNGELFDVNNNIKTFKIDAVFDNHEIKKRVDIISGRDENFKLALEKYEKVREMRGMLADNNASPQQRLENFRNSFTVNRQLIEQRRDSGAIKFLKVVATIFTFGIAAAAGLWKVKGKQFADDIDKQLPDDNKPGGNKHK